MGACCSATQPENADTIDIAPKQPSRKTTGYQSLDSSITKTSDGFDTISTQQQVQNTYYWTCPQCLQPRDPLFPSCSFCGTLRRPSQPQSTQQKQQQQQQYNISTQKQAKMTPIYITKDITINNYCIKARIYRFNECYTKITHKGKEGTFGTVYKCYKRGDRKKKIYAVKQINKINIYRLPEDKKLRAMENIKNEIEIMSKLQHKNIVSLYDVFETDNYLYLVLDYLFGGELFDKIKKTDGMKESDTANIAKQILDGLSFIHSQNIGHFSLTSNDIMFETKHDDDLNIKIIDFGNARQLKSSQKLHEKVGAPYYMAPEIINGEYDHAVDIWSVGVMVFCMLMGYPPFHIDENFGKDRINKIYELIQNGFKPEICDGFGPWFPKTIPISPNAMDFITKTLKTNVSQRLTVDQCLYHPFIQRENASLKLSNKEKKKWIISGYSRQFGCISDRDIIDIVMIYYWSTPKYDALCIKYDESMDMMIYNKPTTCFVGDWMNPMKKHEIKIQINIPSLIDVDNEEMLEWNMDKDVFLIGISPNDKEYELPLTSYDGTYVFDALMSRGYIKYGIDYELRLVYDGMAGILSLWINDEKLDEIVKNIKSKEYKWGITVWKGGRVYVLNEYYNMEGNNGAVNNNIINNKRVSTLDILLEMD